MPAPKGNQYWKSRAAHGRRLKFPTSIELWVACVEYFEWVDANPLMQEKAVVHQGAYIISTSIPKMRAMTIEGLCLFLGISRETWYLYRGRKDFIGVTDSVDDIVFIQKFTGAAVGLLNARIIAREISLRAGQS